MDPITMGILGASVGLAKSRFIDAPQARRERNLQATTAAYSPWTGMQAQNVKSPDAFGSALQGGVSMYQMGQQSEAQDAANAQLAEDRADRKQMMNSQMEYNKAQGDYYRSLQKPKGTPTAQNSSRGMVGQSFSPWGGMVG